MVSEEQGAGDGLPNNGERGLPRKRLLLRGAIAIATILGVYAGWRAFFFLTDDAYIAFRYVSNSMAGHGLVWNPPPFLPVEGYTSFLWVALLRVAWDLTGLTPPEVANHLSLACGYLAVFVVARFVLRMPLSRQLERHREGFLLLVLLGTLTNRSFLAWLSSGLETALFNACFLWWIYVATAAPARQDRGWALQLSSSATLCALTRPDGILAVLATALVAMRDLRLMHRAGGSASKLVWSAVGKRAMMYAPLLVVIAHLLWRRWYYGAWLPNTYYAKALDAWPESGLRYAACFVLEYGVYVWALLLVAWGALCAWPARGRMAEQLSQQIVAVAAVGVVLAHFAYYTLIIGGDHFEYRVYSHLVPLLFVSALWLATRVVGRALGVHLTLIAFIVASWPIPWLHWLQTHERSARRQTFQLVHPVAPHLPGPLRPLVAQWDRWQEWLIRRNVCARHQEHKVFERFMSSGAPSRAEGERFRWKPAHPIAVSWSVGVVGWVFPEVAIIDAYGLNDRVIARHPPRVRADSLRQMAHEREAPPGYLECFRPNLEAVIGKKWVLHRRERPLTEAEIRACERRRW